MTFSLGKPLIWVSIIIAVVLVALSVSNLILYRRVEPLLSEQMGRRQVFSARVIADGLRPAHIRSYIADPGNIYGRLLTEKLDKYREEGGFTSINLLDTTGVVLYSSGGGYDTGEYFHYLAIDRETFNSALSGLPEATELYRIGESYIRGSYAPVYNEIRDIRWILCIEAGGEYYSALVALRRNMSIFFILSVIGIIGAGIVMLAAASQLRRLEVKLLRASVLSSIGEMAAGVAHEVRNPLAIIRGSTERLSTVTEDRREQLLEFIIDEVSRIDDILDNYLSLARPSEEEKSSVFLGDLAEDVARRVADRAKKSGVKINVELADEQAINVPENALRRCILNIYLNSIEAMPDGGTISVASDNSEENLVSLSICDTGPGIDSKYLERIFDPFISTKPGGTGLGLSLSRRIVEDAGGKLTVKSSPGKGSCFTISIPVAGNK